MRRLIASIAALGVAGSLSAALGEELSTSIMRPTVPTGAISGNLPGASGPRSYYVVLDLAPGDLLTQLLIAGREKGERRLTLELLDASGAVAASTFVRAASGAKDETTKSFPIDSTGRRILRVTVEGEETGAFCVLMGGSTFPSAKDQACPAMAGVKAASSEPPQRAVEVITSKCEERLRVGSDFLFDFDRADLRAEAAPALAELQQRITAAGKKATVEGHTDSVGSDGYNQKLSERRASAVRNALVGRGLAPDSLATQGYGESRPVAPNQNADGSDNPLGRAKNRRVEVVINTCGRS
ncbi:OmpA family protein [Methylocystis sp. B8]|uniref:OmpA family protein n=1 Tax=Methylocystis sp. B8 TaxID=544938 RepID=UPI0010FE9E7B|nr:OmpA family protein [Methylocystis sp. B8]TLG77773.1 OmpA family protein [Methylocystis sp. B8]